MIFIFVAGIFSSNTQLEKIAAYATEVVVKHTEKKSLCAITVEKSSESGPIIDSNTEFHSLYGIFQEQKITFASTINADKRHNIIIDDDLSENLSMLYVGPVGTISYHGHYKHYSSPIEVMFPDENLYDISNYVAYISQSDADKILERANVARQDDGAYLPADYKSLVKQLIPISVDGESTNFVIQNIY